MSGPEKPLPTWDLSLHFVLLMSSDEYHNEEDDLLSLRGLKGGFWKKLMDETVLGKNFNNFLLFGLACDFSIFRKR